VSVHRGGGLPAAPGDQVLGQEVGGNRIIREVFESPAQQILRLAFVTGADQQPGQLVAGDRITWVARMGLPEQSLCLCLPSLVQQEPGELVAEHGIVRQTANRRPVDGLGDVRVADAVQCTATQVPGVTIVRGPTEGIAQPGESMIRRPGQNLFAQVAGGTDEEIGIAGGLSIVLQIDEQPFGLGQDQRLLLR